MQVIKHYMCDCSEKNKYSATILIHVRKYQDKCNISIASKHCRISIDHIIVYICCSWCTYFNVKCCNLTALYSHIINKLITWFSQGFYHEMNFNNKTLVNIRKFSQKYALCSVWIITSFITNCVASLDVLCFSMII